MPHPTAGKFAYTSAGFLYDSETRNTQAAILKRLKSPDQVTVKWLRSQLAHYALKPLAGNKDELEARLRRGIEENKVKMQPKEMRDLEKGLKAAAEARRPGATKGAGVEKKRTEKATPPPSAAQRKKDAAILGAASKILAEAASTHKKPAVPPKKVSPAAPKKAAAPVKKETPPLPKNKTVRPPTPPPPKVQKPRIAFADRILGTYQLNYQGCSELVLYRKETSITGTLELDGRLVQILLEWIPLAKQSKVPFSCYTGETGDIEFRVLKGGAVRIKGRVAGVDWAGFKNAEGDYDDEYAVDVMEVDAHGYW